MTGWDMDWASQCFWAAEIGAGSGVYARWIACHRLGLRFSEAGSWVGCWGGWGLGRGGREKRGKDGREGSILLSGLRGKFSGSITWMWESQE